MFLFSMSAGCITDSGEIESSCDEVPEPCLWESADTGGGDEAED